MPDVGEQVAVLMDEHYEDGAVLGAIYSSVDPPPGGMTADKRHLTTKDSAIFEYDRNQHKLTITLPAGATMNVQVNGSQAISFDSSGNLNFQAPAGDINFVTSEHADSVNSIIDKYNTHTHTDPQGGSVGTPTPTMP
jgi:phage baseplate assembly protein V